MPSHAELGHELPGEGDRVALEVVAEGEVAEHLEEGVVPLGVAHLLEVVVLAAGADALLAGDGALVVAWFHAEKGPLELVHPGVGEQQRRVVGGEQRGGGHLAVPLALEILDEAASDVGGVHPANISRVRGAHQDGEGERLPDCLPDLRAGEAAAGQVGHQPAALGLAGELTQLTRPACGECPRHGRAVGPLRPLRPRARRRCAAGPLPWRAGLG